MRFVAPRVVCIAFAVGWIVASCAGCCGDRGSPTPARPPGILPPGQQAQPDLVEPPTAPAPDDDSGNAADDDSAEEPVVWPPDEQVREDLVGQVFCYEGQESDGLFWTIQAAEITEFAVVGHEIDRATGWAKVDVTVHLDGEFERLDGGLRVVYRPQGEFWVATSVTRWPPDDFRVKEKAAVPDEVRDRRRLRDMTCDIVARAGMCWEYDRAKLLEIGSDGARHNCVAWGGTFSDAGCPLEGREAICIIDGAHRLRYYEVYDTANPMLSYQQHCELSDGSVAAAN